MKLKSIKYEDAVADLEKHPRKKLMWTSGLWNSHKREISREPREPKVVMKNDGSDGCRGVPTLIKSWKDELWAEFRWACIVEVESNTDDEMWLHGYSGADMF